MSFSRGGDTATSLPHGDVLVVGGTLYGTRHFSYVLEAELYSHSSGTWSNAGATNGGHSAHRATPLNSGQVLITGGVSDPNTGGAGIAAAELWPSLAAQITPPINADGSSVFNANRGVVPVKFTLTAGGVPTCKLPPATIALTRTFGGVLGPINENQYAMAADNGSKFRVSDCQYVYNLGTGSLGVGTYRVDILIGNTVVGSAMFGLK